MVQIYTYIYIFILSTIDHYWLLHGQFKSSQELRGRNLHFECREVSSGGDSEINKWLGEGHRALVWKHGENKEFIMKKGDLNLKTYMKIMDLIMTHEFQPQKWHWQH